MGLSASQARGILIEAKLHDVEFEAQQINQARSQLSTQSANYYNQLLNMDVPVPPTKGDYTTTTYTYNDSNAKAHTITNIGAVDKNGKAEVTIQTTGEGAKVESTGNSGNVTTTMKAGDKTFCTTDKSKLYDDANLHYVKNATVFNPGASYIDNNGNSVNSKLQELANQTVQSNKYVDANGNLLTTYSGGDIYESVPATDPETGAIIPNKYVADKKISAEDFYDKIDLAHSYFQEVPQGEETHYIGSEAVADSYQINGNACIEISEIKDAGVKADFELAIQQTGRKAEDYYAVYNGSEWQLVLQHDVEDNDGTAELHTVNRAAQDAIITEQKPAELVFDNTSGRPSKIVVDGKEYQLTPVTVTDEVAYEDAMNAYAYEKACYDQEQTEINAQMSLISAQDKKLELKLTQLDTERSELTTELEAVEKVLGENVDRTFKTFNG